MDDGERGTGSVPYFRGFDGWERTPGGIPIIDLDALERTHAARTGAINIAMNWQHWGPVLDLNWLGDHVHELGFDAAIGLLVDFASFPGDDDLNAHADVLADEINRRWPEEPPSAEEVAAWESRHLGDSGG